MAKFSHLDEQGKPRMVDVSHKPVTHRTARASCLVHMQPETQEKIRRHEFHKGDVLQVARLAGIMAAKKTADLIPLCHPLPISSTEIELSFADDRTIAVDARVAATSQTGVEMEALTAASVTALTIYDMCKSVDRSITIGPLQLEEKAGGKSGHFKRKENAS